MARTARIGSGAPYTQARVLLVVLAAAAGAARASLPPLTYPVSTDAAELEAALLGGSPPALGVTLTVPDAADPQLSYVEIWRQNADGTLSLSARPAVPEVYAQLPVRVGSALYDDIFYVTYGSGQVQCGLISGAGGAYDPNGSILTSYPQGIAPPRGRLLVGSNNLNGSSGTDVGVLATGERVFVFLDDGAGGLDPAFQTVALPAGADADGIAFADVTGDGLPDLLAGSRAGEVIHVLENTTAGSGPLTFTLLQQVSIAGLRGFRTADVNGDGADWSDVVAIRSLAGQGALVTLPNERGPTPFAPVLVTAVDPEPVALALTDITPADGHPDVFVACRSAAGHGTLVELANDGAGNFAISGQYIVVSPTAQNASASATFVGVHDGQAGAFTIFPMDDEDANASPADEIAAGAGPDPGASAEVLVFRGDGSPIVTASVIPYASTYGVRVGNGNVDGTETLHAKDELLTGPGPSPSFGPHVRAFRRSDVGLSPVAKVNFYAYGTLRGGVSAVGPDIDADESDEILTGAGPLPVFGPHVRAWNYDGVVLAPISKVNFFAYGTLKFGVEVGGGFDGEGDDYDEILTCPGPGPTFAAQVRAFDYDDTQLRPIAKINFVAMPAPMAYGGNVTGGDVDDDGIDEIQAGRGPGASQVAEVAGFDYDGVAIAALPGYRITAFATLYGARVNHGDLGGDLEDEQDELIVGSGSDPFADATVKAFLYDGATLLPGLSFPTHPGTAYGANPGGVYFGF